MFARIFSLMPALLGVSMSEGANRTLLMVEGGNDDARNFECKASPEDDEMTLMQMTLMQRTSAMHIGQWRRELSLGYGSGHVSRAEAALREQPGPDAASTGISTRPHAGSGPETVNFGVYAKSVSNINMPAKSFTIDSVMTFRWDDIRAVSLLPQGLHSLTFSREEVQDSLWLPDIAITNHKIGEYEVISTSVIVNSSGEVKMIERSLSETRANYDLHAFPWDTQVLEVKLASTTYLLDAVKLVPIKEVGVSGLSENALAGGGFKFLSYDVSEFEEVDGTLSKSRGIMRIRVQRVSSMYIHDHLIPSVFLLIMSWCVFALPFDAQYCMPRLMLACVTLLSFTTLSGQASTALPPGSPLTWNDAYNQNVQYLMFIVVCLNIFAELVYHELKRAELALRMHWECRWLLLVTYGVTLCILVIFRGSMQSERICRIVQLFSLFATGTYVLACALRIYSIPADKHGQFGRLHSLVLVDADGEVVGATS
mmetsp:Transcript_119198/g.243800  ORF Transcript_119198/g.243800 Transcript_119198/m.243800 type:complete len:483 (-) Transcript_119198:64-1512(-)